MQIVVCIKQVLDTNCEFAPKGKELGVVSPVYVMNEYDVYAINLALALKEKLGAQIVAFCVGPFISIDMLASCLAMGVDRAIRIRSEELDTQNPSVVALALGQSIRQLNADLILTGFQAVDDAESQTGILLSEFLGLPNISGVTDVSIKASTAVARFDMGEGIEGVAEVKLPALLTVLSGNSTNGYVPLVNKLRLLKRVESVQFVIGPELVGSVKREVIEYLETKGDRKAAVVSVNPEEAARLFCQTLAEAGIS